MFNLDVEIFKWLNSWAGVSYFFDWAIIFRAVYLWYIIMFAVFLFPVLALLPRFRRNLNKNLELFIFAFFSASIARFVITEFIRRIYNRPRPFIVLSGVNQLVDNVHQIFNNISTSSFPSGHASLAFAVSMSIYFYYPKLSILFFLAAISIGMGRIAAGVHWPSDILGGAIIGIFTSILVKWAVSKPRPWLRSITSSGKDKHDC